MAITLDGTSGITSPTLDSTGTTTISTNNVALRLKDSSGSLYEAIKATSSNQLQLSSGGASSSYLFYANAGTLKLRIDNDGLKFNSDTAAANALDDYEEGTWTPTLLDGAASSRTLSVASGSYTKIGNTVYARFNITRNDAGGTNGNLQIGGFPFTTTNTTEFTTGGGMWIDEGGPASGLSDSVGSVFMPSNSTQAFGVKTTNPAQQAGSRYFLYQEFSNNRYIYGSITYTAA